MKTREQLTEEALDAARGLMAELSNDHPLAHFVAGRKLRLNEALAELAAVEEEPSEKEADELVKIAFLEWSNSPSANSAIANLRNKLCTVIGEREDLKRELARIKEPSDTITLPRELMEKTIIQVRRVCDPQSGALLPDSLFIVKQLTTALSQQPTKAV